MFIIGDLVRLSRGWTPMIVIQVKNGYVRAKYANNEWCPVLDIDIEKPLLSNSTYHRPIMGFTAWDRPEHQTPKLFVRITKMKRRFKIKLTGEVGTFLNTTSIGQMVLELDNGIIVAVNSTNVELDVPFTFAVKSLANNHRCHYLVQPGVTIVAGDLLLSDSGNAYSVTSVGTKNDNPKGVFKGRRIQTTAL